MSRISEREGTDMIDGFIEDIDSCLNIVPARVRVGLMVVFCVGSILLLSFKGFKRGGRWSARLLLLEYLFLLFSLTVLFRQVQTARTFDFVPFWSYRMVRGGGHDLLFIQIIENVIAFIPIGLLLGISFPNIKWLKVLLVGGAFSLLIEMLQFFLRRGFAEFDDVVHNVLGCMIGYGFYIAITCFVTVISKKRALTHIFRD